MKTAHALCKYGRWRLFRFAEQDELFATKAEGLSRLEGLKQGGLSFARLSHPLTLDEYRIDGDRIVCVRNHDGLAGFILEQTIAYSLLLLGVGIAFWLSTLNPKWAWWFISIVGMAGGLVGVTMLMVGLAHQSNKRFLLLGVVVYFLPAIGAFVVETNQIL